MLNQSELDYEDELLRSDDECEDITIMDTEEDDVNNADVTSSVDKDKPNKAVEKDTLEEQMSADLVKFNKKCREAPRSEKTRVLSDLKRIKGEQKYANLCSSTEKKQEAEDDTKPNKFFKRKPVAIPDFNGTQSLGRSNSSEYYYSRFANNSQQEAPVSKKTKSFLNNKRLEAHTNEGHRTAGVNGHENYSNNNNNRRFANNRHQPYPQAQRFTKNDNGIWTNRFYEGAQQNNRGYTAGGYNRFQPSRFAPHSAQQPMQERNQLNNGQPSRRDSNENMRIQIPNASQQRSHLARNNRALLHLDNRRVIMPPGSSCVNYKPIGRESLNANSIFNDNSFEAFKELSNNPLRLLATFFTTLAATPTTQHKPIYDMKVQEKIHELQDKPFHANTLVIPVSGPGRNDVRVPAHTTDLTMGMRFT